MARPLRLYLLYTAGLLCFYLVSPAISYLVFWSQVARPGLSTIHFSLLIPALVARLFFLLTGHLNIRTRHLALVYLLLIWISVLQLIWLPFVSPEIESQTLFSHMALTLVGPWLLALGGESFAYLCIASPQAARGLVAAAYSGLTFAIADGVGAKGFGFYGRLFFAFQDPVSRQVYSYLSLADSVAIVGLLLLGLVGTRSFYGGIIVYSGTLLLLLFSYSRSSFFCFLLSGAIMLDQRFWRTRKQQHLLAILGAVILAFIAVIAWPMLGEVKENLFERNYLLLERFSAPFVGTDASVQRRQELLREGLDLLAKRWLLGHFMAEVVEAGRGTYIHNLLSFWVAYGIGPFLLLVWLLLSLIVRNWRQRKRSTEALIGFSLLVFIFLSISFSRSYVWPYFWLGLSFAATGLLSKRESTG